MDRLTQAVRYAVNHAPCSVRALADEADVDHGTLVRIRTGERRATVAVARKVRAALTRWKDHCRKGESVLKHAISHRGEP